MPFRRLIRGYALSLAFVAALHAAAWVWIRKPPVETPVVVPPMVDVDLITEPKIAAASSAAPAPAAAPRPAVRPPKKADVPPKPKPKPKPPPKPIEPSKAAEKPEPVEHTEATRPVPQPAVPAASSASPAASSAASHSAAAPRGIGQGAGKGAVSGSSDQPVTPAHDAGYLHNPKPKYPAIAVARNWEGLVRLRVYVLPNGTAGQVLLQQSSGHDALDEAALDVVRRWRFVPAQRGEQAVASWVVVPLVFKLNSGR